MRYRRDAQLAALFVLLALAVALPIAWHALHPPPPFGDTRLDLNRATIEELECFPRVGPVRAQAILRYREEHGGFRSLDELRAVPGLDERTREELRPHLKVE